ncbi:MAG: hypothetical protein ABFD69_08715 [Candidatus Sumerlaeia bacterium]
MKASMLDLRRNPRKIIEAIERDETVTLSRRGCEIALIIPKKSARPAVSIKRQPAFGMWKERADMANPAEYVRKLRRGRIHDL